MISITNDDYEMIVEVSRTGLSELRPAILEKDLLITKTLGLLQDFNWEKFSIVFCGGTSLSKGYKLIDRMSEDVDFKVIVPQALSRSQCRRKLGKLRQDLTQHLSGEGFNVGSPDPRNENRYFHFPLGYASRFPEMMALRPEIKLDFIARTTTYLEPEEVHVKSLLSEVVPEREEPLILCHALDYKETLVEKVVAFLRRTASWSENNLLNEEHSPEDKRLVRHLYDVHQILQNKSTARQVTSELQHLFQKIIKFDRDQFGSKDRDFAENAIQRLSHALRYLHTNPSKLEVFYKVFVNELVWGQLVDFNEAREAFHRLACQLLNVTQ
ncbi:nucleotidyl transferase AbiEii/AbiGii toxin family protein [Candidatus Synechococcus spongiarum]|uniref:nucleotidyl transferase AbiEii/AbiGii toxin family protein n=1 Tax=Candidatus Synechococcus spongiarum TaxID=431041 RepID=UPI00126806F8|nr:nucleotidyl transferase AbiEii/AbiGii toxin family protein [Candidatus Synechococcus spongiarum]